MIFGTVEWPYDFAKFPINFQDFQSLILASNQPPTLFNTVPSFNTVLSADVIALSTLSNVFSTADASVQVITVGPSIGFDITAITDQLTGNFAANRFPVHSIDDGMSSRMSTAAMTAETTVDLSVDFATLLNSLNLSANNQASFSLFGNNRFNTSPTAENYFVTHGYRNSSETEWVSNISHAIKGIDTQANVILVDWEDQANPGLLGLNYAQAAENTLDVGQYLGEFLNALPINPDSVQLIGHSLGAHVNGIAGNYYKVLTSQELDIVIGLDPAGPGFEDPDFLTGFTPPPLTNRLDATDAEQVIVYHTSDVFGYEDRLGDLDLYINSDDLFQPGQFSAAGNHGYAHTLYTQLIAGQTFIQPDGSVFGYDDQFALTGSFNIETVA